MDLEITITVPEELVEKVKAYLSQDGKNRTPAQLDAEARCCLKRAIRKTIQPSPSALFQAVIKHHKYKE